jgi:hypothetical protein
MQPARPILWETLKDNLCQPVALCWDTDSKCRKNNTKGYAKKPGTLVCAYSLSYLEPRLDNHLSPGVLGQPEQHGKNPPLKNK